MNVATKDLRRHLSDYLNPANHAKERHVVTRKGKNVAAVVPMEDFELLEALEDVVELDEARKALAEAARQGTVRWDDLKAELGL